MNPHSSSSKISFFISRVTKRIWFRALIYAVIGVATAFVAFFAKGFVPEGYSTKIGADAVGNILTILASSMLAVATFSLSIMVTAFGNASTGASPRATKLLIENQNAQRAVATFIGAFLYSVVGIIALATGFYGEEGRFVLFVVTNFVIIVIVITLIKWVDQLATLGRVGSTIIEVEKATRESLKQNVLHPFLGGRKKSTDENLTGSTVTSSTIGYIAFVDMEAIQKICTKLNVNFSLAVLPGSFNYPGRKLGQFDSHIDDKCLAAVTTHFVVEVNRTFNQDIRYGFVLLSEIASRALSAAVNDAGTAIEVVNSGIRLLTLYSDLHREFERPKLTYPNISAPEINPSELIENIFLPIARDGSDKFEVQIRLQKGLNYLAQYDKRYIEGAKTLSQISLEYGLNKMDLDYEKAILKKSYNSQEPKSNST